MHGDAGEDIAVTVSVDENPTYLSRSFTLTVCSSSLRRSIDITQLKRNAIISSGNRFDVTYDAQTLSVEIQSNVEYEAVIVSGGSWLSAANDTRTELGLTSRVHRFEAAANHEPQERTAQIIFKDLSSDLQDEVTVVQAAYVDPERAALLAIYRDAAGDGWTHRDNWCSDSPLDEWYGVETDDEGHVTALRLRDNNLRGTLSKKLADLTHLRHIDMSRNSLGGMLCLEYRNDDLLSPLSELETADFSHNELGGTLSLSWHKLERLVRLDLSSNGIEGSIPIQWTPMFSAGRCVDLRLYNSRLSGDIPACIQNHPDWSRLALQIVRQRPLLRAGVLCAAGLTYSKSIVVPDISLTLANGTRKELRAVCSDNDLTMLLHWNPLQPRSAEFVERVVRRFYALYGDMRFAVVAMTPSGDEYREAAGRCMQQQNIPWTVAVDCTDTVGERPVLLDEPYPGYLLIDRQGCLRMEMADGNYADFVKFEGFEVDMLSLSHTDYLNRYFKDLFGRSTYESIDYSRDKQYETLQRASKGRGIDIVLIGEAFTDVDIEAGIYRELMLSAADAMFDVEPMKTYRDYFNIHIVYAVSRKPYIGTDRTQVALGTVTHTSQGINNRLDIIKEYAYVPVGNGSLLFPGIIINDCNVGLTWMEEQGIRPCFAFSGYSFGGVDQMQCRVMHELVGHGLGLLADEYVDLPNIGEAIPQYETESLIARQRQGKCQNVSCTNDPAQVLWSHLIGHPKYPYVGLYEGAHYYGKGVWRSENNSIMRETYGTNTYFNAICRELIVKRILTLAGEEYSFEKFLANDSDEGRPKAKAANRDIAIPEPSHIPPIFYQH